MLHRRLFRIYFEFPRKASIISQLPICQNTWPLNHTRNFAKKSWIPTEDDLLQKVTIQALVHEISLDQAVPWFLKSMPASYFRQVPLELRKSHIKAIAAIRDLKQSDLCLKIETIADENSTEITMIQTTAKPGILLSQLKSLITPPDSTLCRIRVFSTSDGELSLNIFSFQKSHQVDYQPNPEDTSKIFQFIENSSSSPTSQSYQSTLFALESLEKYFTYCSPSYIRNADPRRFLIQREMYEKIRGTDGTDVHIETYTGDAGNINDPGAWITIAAGNIQPDILLKSTVSLLSTQKYDIHRAHLDTLRAESTTDSDFPVETSDHEGFVTMLRLLVSPDPALLNGHKGTGQDSVGQTTTKLAELMKTLRRVKWLDDDVINLGVISFPALGIDRAEVILALCSLSHGPLAKLNPYAFASVKSVIQILGSNPHFMGRASDIADLFMDKFRPLPGPISQQDFTAREAALRLTISKLVHEGARAVLTKLLDATVNSLRTNFYMPDRYALSIRVDPIIMQSTQPFGSPSYPTPFGVFFVHGKQFNGFHCRFRDIARGGLRVVTPPNADQYAIESSRHFDEAYGLSLAQQLKNKDIPEGGAKAVVLVNTPAVSLHQKSYTIRTAIKAFTDSLLDLITKRSLEGQVDYYKREELIYLGPDEQVIPSDIDWIVARAAIRGYPIPAAFMSSKRNAGFNHKEFGVTSEGVCVYLAVALKNSLNIDPKKQPFTVKITGGPDGDVAGNLMRILIRDYPDTVKIVGIADGFGVCEDPNGLSHVELLRLVKESLPVTSFSRDKLSEQGELHDVITQEGLQRRNTMHFRLKSDAFIPAGGRPNTINGENWRQFLDEQGRPSSPLIVEGANLFLTPEARDLLFKHGGVHIVKDSSANKCGVITSSFEVAASMLLSTEEFMSIKKDLVQDVLEKLRLLANLEAELLFKEFKNYPGALPQFSERISNAVIKVTDAVSEALADVTPEDALFKELLPLIRENLPKKLADMAWDRVPTHFPLQYQKNAIASTLASKLVYREGIHFVEAQPLDKLAKRAFDYYGQDEKISKILTKLGQSSLESLDEDTRREVMEIVRKGGARALLQIF